MFDLKADGITLRAIEQLGGETGFGEIFLDDVFVPDNDVIGVPNEGWRAAMSTSSNERGMSLRSPARFLVGAEKLAAMWRQHGSDPRDIAGRIHAAARRHAVIRLPGPISVQRGVQRAVAVRILYLQRER